MCIQHTYRYPLPNRVLIFLKNTAFKTKHVKYTHSCQFTRAEALSHSPVWAAEFLTTPNHMAGTERNRSCNAKRSAPKSGANPTYRGRDIQVGPARRSSWHFLPSDRGCGQLILQSRDTSDRRPNAHTWQGRVAIRASRFAERPGCARAETR